MEDGHGSVRVVVERPTPALRELDASARGLAGKRDVIRLEGVRRVRFSPVPADRQLLVEGESRGVGGDPSLPVLADPVVVSAAPGDGLQASDGVLPSTEPDDIQPGGTQSTLSDCFLPSARLATIRDDLRGEGVPGKTIDIVFTASRANTRASYQSAWNVWSGWCV